MKMGSDRLYREVICRLRMSEGRQTQIVLLDDFRLDILVKPKLYAGELLDIVASHFILKEKEYFGLSYIDDTGHHNWLQLERRVLEHDFPKKSSQSTLLLFFRIKYFVESITQLRDNATVEAFYLQAQSLVYQGAIEVNSEDAFQLGALALQSAHGDYIDEETAKEHLKSIPVIPTSTLIEHPSLPLCEKKVIEKYKALTGLSRGDAIVSYMQIVEALPTYGVHYYEVKDRAGLPWWLGISYKGICQYDLTDKKVPRKVFQWKQLENLYYRDRKFSIEVCDPKRPATSRKGFGAGNICVHVWFAANPSLTKCIWSMAISQHQFYLDRKHKPTQQVSRDLSEIAAELSTDNFRSNASTSSTVLSRSGSTHSLPALKISGESWEELKEETVEMLVALKAKKEALEDTLHRKTEELRRLCLQEGELTGILPQEIPLCSGEQIPLTRKRVGSEFTIKERLSWKKKTKEEEELAEAELEYEIQTKIVAASGKLASDPSAKKGTRRQRKISHQKAQTKLKELEHKLSSIRKKVEKLRKDQLRLYSDDEPSEDNLSQSTDEFEVSHTEESHNPSIPSTESVGSRSSLCETSTCTSPVTSMINSPSSSSAPSSPLKTRHPVGMHQNSPDRIPFSHHHHHHQTSSKDKKGYTPSSVYQTRTAYRTQQYPTLPTRLPSSKSAGAVLEQCMKTNLRKENEAKQILSLSTPYQNKFESTLDIDGSNLYSVPTQRTSQAFDTQDDLLAALAKNQPQDLGLISRHNSLDRRHRHNSQKRRYFEKYYSIATSSGLLYSDSLGQSNLYQENSSTSISSPYSIRHPHHYHHHRHLSSSHSRNVDLGSSGASSHKTQTKCQKHPKEYCKCNRTTTKNFSSCVPESMQSQLLGRQHLAESDAEAKQQICSNCYSNSYVESSSRSTHQQYGNASLSVFSSETYYDKTRSFVSSHVKDYSSTSTPATPTNDFEIVKSQSETYQTTKARLEGLNISSLSTTTERRQSSMLPKSQSYYHQTSSVHHESSYNTKVSSSSSSSNVEISVVRYGQFQPYWEETKPYEISDFYKYSTKHRKQQQQQSLVNESLNTGLCNTERNIHDNTKTLSHSCYKTSDSQSCSCTSSSSTQIPVERNRSQSSAYKKEVSPAQSGTSGSHVIKVKKTTLV